VGIIWNYLPKTPLTNIVALAAAFGLLFHPIWNFWWIEETFPRRFMPLVMLATILTYLGMNAPGQMKPETLAPSQYVELPNGSGGSPSGGPSTPRGILPPSPPVTPAPSKPKPATKPSAKPTPESKPLQKPAQTALYPIILAGASSVALKTDTHKLSIDVTFMNTTSTEANGHIILQIFLYVNGRAIGNGPVVDRDHGFGAPPSNYDLAMDVEVPPEFEAAFPTGGASATVMATVTYPDRGGETIYHFEGDTTPNSGQLDMSKTSWEQVSSH